MCTYWVQNSGLFIQTDGVKKEVLEGMGAYEIMQDGVGKRGQVLCIYMGKKLEEGGYNEIREEFAPLVEKALPRVQPRVVTGYATLLWFTCKVCMYVM